MAIAAKKQARTAIHIDFMSETTAADIERRIRDSGLRDAVVIAVKRIGAVLDIIVETAGDMALCVYGRVRDMLSYSDSQRCSCRAIA